MLVGVTVRSVPPLSEFDGMVSGRQQRGPAQRSKSPFVTPFRKRCHSFRVNRRTAQGTFE